jgi:urease accessory protein UreH
MARSSCKSRCTRKAAGSATPSWCIRRAGIAGGDELSLKVGTENGAAALLTTPGAAKWYRSARAWARQDAVFDVKGALEWLPQETIVFDGALAETAYDVNLGAAARFIGWDIVCLGRTVRVKRFSRGAFRSSIRVRREGRLLWAGARPHRRRRQAARFARGIGRQPGFWNTVCLAVEFRQEDS